MSARLVDLRDNDNNIVYPITKTTGVYNDNNQNVEEIIAAQKLNAGRNITIKNQAISVSDYEWYFFNSTYTTGYIKFVTISTAVGGNDSMLNFIVNRSGNNQEIYSGIATIKLRYGGEVQYQSPTRCSIQWLSRTDGFNCDDIVGVDNGNRTVSFYIKTDLRQACSFKVLQFAYSSATTGTAGNYSTYTPITNETVATITPTYTSTDAKPSPYGTNLTSGTFSNGNDYVTETYISSDGNSWYRKWASGWKECGIEATNVTTSWKYFTLPISFITNKYTTVATQRTANITNGGVSTSASQTINQVYLRVNSGAGNAVVYCCGY